MQLYEIKNEDYETKRVAAEDMSLALSKYQKYLADHISIDYSHMGIFRKIKSCVCLGEYNDDDVIK